MKIFLVQLPTSHHGTGEKVYPLGLSRLSSLIPQEYTKKALDMNLFPDPNFIEPGKKGKDRTLRLMELIRPLKITFGMETRPEDLARRRTLPQLWNRT